MANALTLQEFADYIELTVDSMTNGYLLRKSFTGDVAYSDTVYEEGGDATLTWDDRSVLAGHLYTYWITQSDGSTIVTGPTTGRLKQYKLLGRGGGARGGRRRRKAIDYNIECELCGFKFPRNTFRKGYVRPHATGINYLPNAAAPENWTWAINPFYFDANVWNWFINEMTSPDFIFPQIEKDSDLRTPPGHYHYPGTPVIDVASQAAEDNLILNPGFETLHPELVLNPGFETRGTNLVLNPGFETLGGGGADVWANWIEVKDTGQIDNETTIVHSGSNAARLKRGILFTTQIHQTIGVVASTEYQLEFWAASALELSVPEYSIYDVDNAAFILEEIQIPPFAAINTYEQITVPFTTPVGCTNVKIILHAPHLATFDYCYFDDVQVFLGTDIWADWTSERDTGVLDNETSIIHGGSNAVGIKRGILHTTQVHQTITVVAQTFYTLEFWVATAFLTSLPEYAVYDVDNAADILVETQVAPFLLTNQYQKTSYIFETPVGCTNVKISFHAAHLATFSFGYFDDISLRKTGWPNWTAVPDTGTILTETDIVHTGSNAARLKRGVLFTTLISQTVAVTAEMSYDLLFWAASAHVLSLLEYSVYDVNNAAYILEEVQVDPFGAPDTYEQTSVSFLTPVGCTSVKIILHAAHLGTFDPGYFDDVSLRLSLPDLLTIGTPSALGTGTLIAWVYKPAETSGGAFIGWQGDSALLQVNIDDMTLGWNKLFAEGAWDGVDPIILGVVGDSSSSTGQIILGGAQLTTETGEVAKLSCLPHRSSGLGVYTTGGMMNLCPPCYSGLRRRVPWE